MSNAAAPATEGPDRSDAPAHVAIIMDGNGRWAAARGLPRAEGHRRGVEALRRVVRASHELGIRYLTIFSFSSENFRFLNAVVPSFVWTTALFGFSPQSQYRIR